jgi:hypothetical protein
MARTPTDPDCIWNYAFCELIDLGVKIDEYWYSVGNIDYNALDDLQGDYPHLFSPKGGNLLSLVQFFVELWYCLQTILIISLASFTALLSFELNTSLTLN